jgi:hypothetical protein
MKHNDRENAIKRVVTTLPLLHAAHELPLRSEDGQGLLVVALPSDTLAYVSDQITSMGLDSVGANVAVAYPDHITLLTLERTVPASATHDEAGVHEFSDIDMLVKLLRVQDSRTLTVSIAAGPRRVSAGSLHELEYAA